MQICDNELVKEIISGNRCALDVLINRYYDTVYSYTMRQVNDYHTACDLTQEVFIKMMRNISKYKRGSEHFKYWLLAITLNHVRDYYRSRQRSKNTYMAELDYISQGTSDNMINMLEVYEKRQEIITALSNLKDEEKEIVILKYYNDLTIKQISIITGNKESTVKSRLYRSLGKLAEFLKGGYGFEKKADRRR